MQRMLRMMLQLLTLIYLFGFLQSQNVDPLCQAQNCPAQTTCRVVSRCDVNGQSCILQAECLANPPQFSHVGVCITGDPILVERNGNLEDLTCGPSSPCPSSAYCNTDLQDTYATCCLSDPAKPVKSGSCPANTFKDDTFCLDTCNNDGDCRMDYKCCEHGCNRECVPAVQEDLCNKTVCPSGSYCQRPGMPPCPEPGQCWTVGECVPCPPVCAIFCEFGNVKDPNGCPTCNCMPPPTTVTQAPPAPPTPPSPWRFPFRPIGRPQRFPWQPRRQQQQRQQRQNRNNGFDPFWFLAYWMFQ